MEEKLREYAKLLIEVGLNVQKGQAVVIRCPVECAYFARLCAAAAYDVGCREVVMRWTDDYMNRERFLRADDSVFDIFPAWQAEMLNGYADEGAAFLNISARDPEALLGVDRPPDAREPQRDGYPALCKRCNVQCLPLVRRIRPHSELGEESLPRSSRAGGDGQALGRDLHLRPHQRQG